MGGGNGGRGCLRGGVAWDRVLWVVVVYVVGDYRRVVEDGVLWVAVVYVVADCRGVSR